MDALATLASSGGYDTVEAHGGTYQAYAQAKWVADEDLAESVTSIEYFEPIDQPDVPFEQIKEHT